MGLFSMEHGALSYDADFAVYGIAVASGALTLLIAGPSAQAGLLGLLVMLGVVVWTLVEYLLHRFVLHRLPPFRRWHDLHHQRPKALISTPTIFSASLILVLVSLPVWIAAGPWPACAMTLGVMTGYLLYSITHHATHHWHGRSAWLARRKRWHALHHHRLDAPGYYGVTNSFWDRVFGSAGKQA